MYKELFSHRHNGSLQEDIDAMLSTLGFSDLEELIVATIPDSIRLKKPMSLDPALSEVEFLQRAKELGSKNEVLKSFIGQGYHGTHTPLVILRNVLENPGWYTQYTPYQAEIAQGRLEALLNYQTMVSDLTGLEIANASLLDEATAAAEAMAMLFSAKKKNQGSKFFVDQFTLQQTIDVIVTRAEPIGVEVVIGDYQTERLDDSFFAAYLQYPNSNGSVEDYRSFTSTCTENNITVAVGADIMALTQLTPPGEWGATVVVGSTQRFGVPMGWGGPHAGYFATTDKFKRKIPGRIIGISQDSNGNDALRMALQTREQHIKRDKATSNICTAQVLLAIMAGFYAVYHGPDGLLKISGRIHELTQKLRASLSGVNAEINTSYFDTLTIRNVDAKTIEALKVSSVENGFNLGYRNNDIQIAVDETTTKADLEVLINTILTAFNASAGNDEGTGIPNELSRDSLFLTHPVFHSHRTESEMLRYIKSLENKDLSLTHSMISLGSCTMKLNATAEMIPVTYSEFGDMHPFVPSNQAQGYYDMVNHLEKALCEITGFHRMSFQPNAGAQGEYAGLMVIREYFKNRGESHRNVTLIPESAHGTNPASAVMAGMKVVVVKCLENGYIDVEDLKEKADMYKDVLSTFMVTYPSTNGVFEESIMEVTKIIHDCGGQVYMDGANMNAQVGLTNPFTIGADVCHLNLHKTFCIPHGGGGPGMGPIGVAEHLSPYLPGHSLVNTGGEKGIGSISAAPFGSASILLISYAYIMMMGEEGLTQATRLAILNANYMREKLSDHYETLYTGTNGTVAHEMILDTRPFKQTANVQVEDIAKRLMDYGFHAPTVSFPVTGTLMVEPTESESKAEMDRFCEAMISIREEIREIEQGGADNENNVLKHAPHTADILISDDWDRPYSRKKAAYPAEYVKSNKFWPTVGRVDNTYGDRNLVCSCLPIEAYAENS